jgi:subtilisin family serine protease
VALRRALVPAAALAALAAGCAPLEQAAAPRAPACAQFVPNDTHYGCAGSWGQRHDDQWALKRIGFAAEAGARSGWEIAGRDLRPVTVAVIDTGLDYLHPDMPPSRVWRNPREAPDGIDNDGNGYVDDVLGWNFVDGANNPMDVAGHGTHVAGIIAAATGNGEGIAGVNPAARIMALKAIDAAGRARSLDIARAIHYAADQGARVINLSLGGRGISPVERAAVERANEKGALVVVAAGSESREAESFGLAGMPNVVTVAATGADDRRAPFSNWGEAVDIAAPGVEILSLRARRSDFLAVAGVRGYEPGSAAVGRGGRYYRASGTSFAAPFVAGVASLLFARNPALTPAEAKRILIMSARDVESPGWDRLTGYGLLDARAALAADPRFELDARIDGVTVAGVGDSLRLRVSGRAASDALAAARLEIGPGADPARWQLVADAAAPRADGVLGEIPLKAFRHAGRWTLRLVAEHRNGAMREARHVVNLGTGTPGAGAASR